MSSELLRKLELQFGGASNMGKGYWKDYKPYNFPEEYNKNIVFQKKSVENKNLRMFEVGGDRMAPSCGNYSEIYSKYLSPFFNKEKGNFCEVGILKGIGLAIWCDTFKKDWKIYGLDIDLSNFNDNLNNLKQYGAFKKNLPLLHEYNQLDKNSKLFEKMKVKFNVVIDDALHTNEAILNTFNHIEAFLDDEFIYFIEDNMYIYDILVEKYKNKYKIIKPCSSMTIITNK
jgi:hypothetical protein